MKALRQWKEKMASGAGPRSPGHTRRSWSVTLKEQGGSYCSAILHGGGNLRPEKA